MKKVGLIEEAPGVKSSNRLIFLVGMFYSMVIPVLLTIVFKWSAGEFIAVFASLSGVFVGLKLGQKPMEQNMVNKTMREEKTDENQPGGN